MTIDFESIEKKWQRRWAEAHLQDSKVDTAKPHFFMIFAYPGVTGYLHVGHMRGYTISDAICRYKRMTGFNVLFPVGTHATGNGAIAFAKRVERGDESTIGILKGNGCSDEEISKLSDPMEVVGFFNEVYLNDYWKRFGFLSDWRRFTSTVNPDYQKFIEWQMLKLNQKGLLIQKPYFSASCPEHGPVAIDASETDIQKGGNAEVVEYTALKFKFGDKFLVAATLRPETIFGLTNFWVHPNADYVIVKVGGERWILSKEGAEKLKFQKEKVIVEGPIKIKDIIGHKCIAPHTGKEIPILPSELVDPSVGTGLVMSVPSDAPYDWMGLVDLKNHHEKFSGMGIHISSVEAIEPIPIIVTPGWGPLPAVEICHKMGIKELSDPKLEEATQEIYKSGFHKGTMAKAAGEYAGKPVDAAKDEIRAMLLKGGQADLFMDLSEEVICRCGKKVSIKRIPDQWFIDYANKELTEMSKSQAKKMSIFPSEYYDNIQGILEWFRERACVRQGNWIGTRFPLDKKWIVEAIADSTLYPAFYIISLYSNSGMVKPESMTESFFDFVFRGEGDAAKISNETGVQEDLLNTIRGDVEYWYPLDINLGGKEHMTVHFPVFLMNHVGILPERLWPKGIIVNWYITGGAGGKISKSKGGAQPIPGAAKQFGVDPMRLFYAHIASLYVDVAWEDEKVENYRARLLKIESFFDDLMSAAREPRGRIDDWLLSELNQRITNLREAMNSYDLRSFSNEAYFEIPSDLRWYIRRGGGDKETIHAALNVLVRAMTPITPHLAEELWIRMGNEPFVSASDFPDVRSDWADQSASAEEEFLREVSADVGEILKVTGIRPKRVVLTVAPDWKAKVSKLAVDAFGQGKKDIGEIIKKAMELPVSPQERAEIPKFAKSTMTELQKTGEKVTSRLGKDFDELKILSEAESFLSSEYGADFLIQKAGVEGIYDPAGKSRVARPRKPSIFVE
jgi:leucyl-tRNA synthetase